MHLTPHEMTVAELAAEYALNHIHDTIAQCPNARAHADDLAEYRAQIVEINDLLDRIRAELGRYGVPVEDDIEA